MIAIDTNILLRYVVQDDPTLAPMASRVINRALARQEAIHLSVIVLCESVWVLKTRYHFSKPHLLRFLEAIHGEPGFHVENRSVLRKAVEDYGKGPADFADYLIGRMAHAQGCSTTYTFDQGLKHSAHFSLIKTSSIQT